MLFLRLFLSFKETDNTLNYFPTKFISTIITLLLAIPALLISHTSNVSINKFVFLANVCALHSNQLLACLLKHLISIAVYDRIAQRIQRIQPYENRMRQKYYVPSVTTILRKDEPKENIDKEGEETHKQSHCNYPGSFQSFLLLCKVCSSLR